MERESTERAHPGKGEESRARIVAKTGQGRRFRARTPADLVGRFEHQHVQTSLRQATRGNESVRSGTDDDDIRIAAPGRTLAAGVLMSVQPLLRPAVAGWLLCS